MAKKIKFLDNEAEVSLITVNTIGHMLQVDIVDPTPELSERIDMQCIIQDEVSDHPSASHTWFEVVTEKATYRGCKVAHSVIYEGDTTVHELTFSYQTRTPHGGA